jgi:plastocyanin
MRPSVPRTLIAVCATAAIAGCSDAAMPTNPGPTAPTSLRADRGSGDQGKTVKIMDECDPATFNTPPGPGGCQGNNGGVSFSQFVAQLTQLQQVPEWHFAPSNVTLRVGDMLSATNTGGEVHTFTRVRQFGGGIVPFLNTLAGTPTEAAECKAVVPSGLIAPGNTMSVVADEAGDENYQCCIHPWMHATVHVAAK